LPANALIREIKIAPATITSALSNKWNRNPKNCHQDKSQNPDFPLAWHPTIYLKYKATALALHARALPRLGLADLEQARQDEDGPVSCGWALLHALEHAYLHLGHIQLTCQLWRQQEQ